MAEGVDMSQQDDQTTAIRVIAFREGDKWSGQCLEYDIGAQADSLGELRERLEAAIEAECREGFERNGSEFSGIPPAPSYYQQMWEKQAGRFSPGTSLSARKVEYALCA